MANSNMRTLTERATASQDVGECDAAMSELREQHAPGLSTYDTAITVAKWSWVAMVVGTALAAVMLGGYVWFLGIFIIMFAGLLGAVTLLLVGLRRQYKSSYFGALGAIASHRSALIRKRHNPGA